MFSADNDQIELATLRIAVESAIEAVMICNTEGVLEYVNPAFERRSGYAKEEVIGKTPAFLKSDVVDNSHYAELWETIRNGCVWEGNFTNTHKNGELFLEKAVITPVKDKNGVIVKYVAVKRDITEYEQMKESLQQERAILNEIIAAIPYDVYWKDRESRYLGCNRMFAEAAGLSSPSEVVGKTDFELPWARKQAESYRQDDLLVMLADIAQLHYEEVQLRADGQSITVDTSKVPLRNTDGEVVGVLGIYNDITERKSMEAQLMQAQKLESIGQLAAGIAHEINTPTQYVGDNTRFIRDSVNDLLAVIDVYENLMAKVSTLTEMKDECEQIAEVINELDIDFVRDEVPKAIEQTLEGVSRVAEIVGAMKDFSHPGGSEKSQVDLNRAISSTITVCRNRWKYIADLTEEYDTSLPLVPCFIGEFNQVILNVVVNAADAIVDVVGDSGDEKGAIHVSTRRSDEWVEVRIVDSGGGIPEDIQANVFDPFFTTKEVGKGTGQGLAICHDVIVNKHGGAIELESEVGVGTTFIIRLPLFATTLEQPNKVA